MLLLLAYGPSPRTWGERVITQVIDYTADHPHARGENTSTRRWRIKKRTIPTHVGRTLASEASSETRTIPTHVGRTRRDDCLNVLRTIPTHVGRTPSGSDRALRLGPSPRTWGERLYRPQTAGVRTIPTHVGRTSRDDPGHRSAGPSPRAWGELRPPCQAREPGPSPRTWGEQCEGANLRRTRTIPTRVGRTPRRRGRRRHAGPSPRAWGERDVIEALHVCVRTIPTHVGRTTTHRRGSRTSGPSPRAWGERGLTNADIVAWRTIPTRVGRTPVGILGAHTLGRTIPTRVGRTPNPLSGRLMWRTIPTHVGRTPRSRLADNQGGPSPRAWGERSGPGVTTTVADHPHAVGRTARKDGLPAERTIPTRVGRTRRRFPAQRAADHPHARGENSEPKSHRGL